MMKKQPNSVLADTSQWSASSQRAIAVDYVAVYEDIAYQCQYCSTACVFTAEAQKHTYEVKKKYYWQRRVLCAKCVQDKYAKAKALAAIAQQWRENKAVLQHDKDFIRSWITQYEDLQRYTNKRYTRIEALKKRLEKLQEKTND